MKKLLSLVLCAVLLCSIAVFPTSARDAMTAEEFEKAFFGDYYITDEEARAFLMNGCPGTYNGEYSYVANKEYIPLKLLGITESYYISLSNPIVIRENLKEYLPLVDFYTVEANFSVNNILLPYDSMTTISVITFTPFFDWNNYTENDVDMYLYAIGMSKIDREYFNIKMLYVLAQYMADHSDDILSPYVNSCGLAYNYIAFFATEDIKGDANGDDKVNGVDVALIKRCIAGMDSRIALHNADVNGDGKVNSGDVLLTKRMIAGLI